MKTKVNLATLTTERPRPTTWTGAELGAREQELLRRLVHMLPCAAKLGCGELRLYTVLNTPLESWQLCMVPRVQGVLDNAWRLDRCLEEEAELLFADLQSLQSRLARATMKVRVDLETCALPLEYRDALYRAVLRAERSRWEFELRGRQFTLAFDGALAERWDASPLFARAKLEGTSARKLRLRGVNLYRSDDRERLVQQQRSLDLHVEPAQSGALLLLDPRHIFHGQTWTGLVKLRRSTVSGAILGGVLVVDPDANRPRGEEPVGLEASHAMLRPPAACLRQG